MRKGLISRLYKEYVLPGHVFIIVFVAIAGVLISLVKTAIPYYLKYILDFAQEKQLAKFLRSVELLTISFFLLLALYYFYGYFLEWVGVRVKERIRIDLLAKLHTIPFNDVISTSQGSYIQRIIDDVDKISPLILEAYLELGTQFLTAVFALILALKLSWQLTLVCLAFLPFYILLALVYKRKAVPLTYERQKDYQDVLRLPTRV